MSERYVGNQAAAEYVGISPRTWSAYVARGQAPKPDGREVVGHLARPYWLRETLDNWQANRPGRGWRAGDCGRSGATAATS